MTLPRVPFNQALVRSSLWFGCDPVSLMVLAGVSALIGIAGGIAYQQFILAPVGVLLFWLGRKGLMLVAKHDVQHPWVYFRACAYDVAYDARSRWDRAERASRGWL